MNYTLTQAIDRAKDLSGLLKAARAHEVDCAADHSAKLRIAEIAAEAHEKASAACVELEQEREALADHIAALVRKVGDPLELQQGESAPDERRYGVLRMPNGEHIKVYDGENVTYEPSFGGRTLIDGVIRLPMTGLSEDEEVTVYGAYNSIFTEGADFQAQTVSEQGESWCPQHQCYHTLDACLEPLRDDAPTDFHSQALQNGLDRIGEALDASRT